MNSFPPIDVLIPQKPPMQLVDEVAYELDEGIVVIARPDPVAWYVDEQGTVPAWIGLEIMAQAISAWAGLQCWRAGKPLRKGFFIGTREFTTDRPHFRAGEELFIEARKVFSVENGLAAFDCIIRAGTVPVANATIKVFTTEEYEIGLNR